MTHLSRRQFQNALALTALGSVPSLSTAQVAYEQTREVYTALRNQPHQTMTVGSGTIAVVYADGGEGLDRGLIEDWIRTNSEAVIHYFGRFPVERVGLLIIADDGVRLHGGTAYGFDTSAIRIRVGRRAGRTVFETDWRMAHELTHLALPVVPTRSWWMLEGSATYVEPIARAQVGQLSPEQAWGGLVRGTPQGLPPPGDQGLDVTRTWGRTYWGGAIFCLLADVMIRERTGNRLGLQDAFRAINRESGGNTARWSMERLTAVGDRATGTPVLADLYARLSHAAVVTDLASLYADLGIRISDGRVTFDDAARWATIRQHILPG